MALSAKDVALAISKVGTASLTPKGVEVSRWLRISDKKHTSGLGFAMGASSRFSDPRPLPQFGVVYLAQDLATAVAEAIVRDRKVASPGVLRMSYEEAIGRWKVFELSTVSPLQLLNLSGMGMIFAGVPTDIVRDSDHTNSQQLSIAVHGNAAGFDGIYYPSRFFGECICVYDRAIPHLQEGPSELLSNLEGPLAAIFKEMGIEIVR